VTATALHGAAPLWPQFAAEAHRVGVGAVAAVPMHAEHEAVGALILCAPPKRPWDRDELAMAEVLAGLASVYVQHDAVLRDSERPTGQLQEAPASRVVIGQPKGVIAETNHIRIPAAFERIRRRTRSSHTSVHSVAEAIVTAGLRG
jgi:hypothetical protein